MIANYEKSVEITKNDAMRWCEMENCELQIAANCKLQTIKWNSSSKIKSFLRSMLPVARCGAVRCGAVRCGAVSETTRRRAARRKAARRRAARWNSSKWDELTDETVKKKNSRIESFLSNTLPVARCGAVWYCGRGGGRRGEILVNEMSEQMK